MKDGQRARTLRSASHCCCPARGDQSVWHGTSYRDTPAHAATAMPLPALFVRSASYDVVIRLCTYAHAPAVLSFCCLHTAASSSSTISFMVLHCSWACKRLSFDYGASSHINIFHCVHAAASRLTYAIVKRGRLFSRRMDRALRHQARQAAAHCAGAARKRLSNAYGVSIK